MSDVSFNSGAGRGSPLFSGSNASSINPFTASRRPLGFSPA